jgi:cytochrome c oxidase assembly factor CtaG/cytochrome c2
MQLKSALWVIPFAVLPPSAAAHGSEPVGSLSHVLLTGWRPEAATAIPLAIASLWYACGVSRAIQENRIEVISRARVFAFVSGILVLMIALESPIDALSEDLFSVHMCQHLLLMLAAPPLLVWSDCPIMFLRALPRPARKTTARIWLGAKLNYAFHWLMHPLFVWMAFCGAFVFWHAPRPYQWALGNNGVHVIEHLSFFVTSLGFWSLVLPPREPRRRLQHGPTLLLIVSTAVLSGLPGALMIFSPRPLYPAHAAGVMKWGMSLMEDQQIAGLIMWIPAGAAYILAVVLVFLQWLRQSEARALRAARHGAVLLAIVVLAGPLLGGCSGEEASATTNFGGDAHRGAELIGRYGCGNCHEIPKIANARGNVGPPLAHVGTRTYLAGYVRNSPDNMALWVRHPQRILPGNAMPDMGVSEKDAQDITAFLYSLK